MLLPAVAVEPATTVLSDVACESTESPGKVFTASILPVQPAVFPLSTM
jgi:hypothetical protein